MNKPFKPQLTVEKPSKIKTKIKKVTVSCGDSIDEIICQIDEGISLSHVEFGYDNDYGYTSYHFEYSKKIDKTPEQYEKEMVKYNKAIQKHIELLKIYKEKLILWYEKNGDGKDKELKNIDKEINRLIA